MFHNFSIEKSFIIFFQRFKNISFVWAIHDVRASSAKERGLWCVWYLRLLHKQIKFSWYQWILGEALSFVIVDTPLCSRCKLHTHPHPTKKRYFQFVYSFIQFLTLGFICLITIYGGKWSESSDISSLEKIWRNFRNFSRSSCSIIIYFSFVTIKLHAGLHTKLRLTHKWRINAVATFICTLIDCKYFFNAIHWAGNNDNCYRGNLSQELSLIFCALYVVSFFSEFYIYFCCSMRLLVASVLFLPRNPISNKAALFNWHNYFQYICNFTQSFAQVISSLS